MWPDKRSVELYQGSHTAVRVELPVQGTQNLACPSTYCANVMGPCQISADVNSQVFKCADLLQRVPI